MIPLNYNHLYYFYKIAQIGSIAETARQILVSGPALSMQLKEFEEHLGIELFKRENKKLILTDMGAIVLEYAKDIFHLGDELKNVLNHSSDKKVRLDIGCQDSIPKNVVDEFLTYLLKTARCQVSVREGTQADLFDQQMHYKLDLILVNKMPNQGQNSIYASKKIVDESLILCASPKFLKMQKNFPQSIQNAPFILPTYHSGRREKLESYFHDNQIQVEMIAEIEDSALEIELALEGLGLIAVMKSSVAQHLKKKSLVNLAELKTIKEEVWMILGKRKILNPHAFQALKKFVFKPLKDVSK